MCIQIIDILTGTANFLNNAAVGAFLGAFFAFIFGIIAYDYTKHREKWKAHHGGVVKAERLLNRHLNQISGNIHLLKGALDTYVKNAFSENGLNPIEDIDLAIDFHNIGIINVYMDYQSLVEKVNHDLGSWNRSNDRQFTAALSGVVHPADIAVNRKHLADRTKEIIQHLEDLMQETYSTGAYIREFLKFDKRARFARLKYTENISISEEQVAAERIVFVQQSEDTMKKDREGRLKKYAP